MNEAMFPGENLTIPMSLQLLSERINSNMRANSLEAMPVPTDTRQRSQILESLDDNIQNLQRYTYDLKTYRNSITSVNLLPDELMAKIFAQYRYEEVGGPWQTGWCKILYVCKRWKNCALSTSQLWSCIGNANYSSEDALGRMLHWHKLSKGYPLQLQFHFSDNSPESNYLHMILQKTPVHQIVSLELSGTPAKLRDFLSYAEPFVFTMNVAFKATSSFAESGPFLFPDHLFSFDKMQSLSLENVPIFPVETFRRMSHLTSFIYKRMDRDMDFLRLFDLLAVLGNCSQLAHLELFDAVELSSSEVSHLVNLPVLESIVLCIDAPAGNNLLKWIRIPASTSINIQIIGILDELDELLHRLGTHLRRADSPTFRSMFLSRGGDYRLCTLGLSETRAAPSEVGLLVQGKGLPFCIGLPMTTPSPRQRISVLRQLFHELPLQNIEDVNATGNTSITYDGLSQKAWRTFFTFLPGPVSVSIGMNDCLPMLLRGYLDTFTHSEKAAAGGRAWSRLCRRSHLALRELKLYGKRYAIEREELYIPAVISFLHRYKELKSEYKGVGELFQQIKFPDPHATYPNDIFPLVGSLILHHGRNYDPEIAKRKRVLYTWRNRQKHPELLQPEDEELLMKHGHNIGKDGQWISTPGETSEPMAKIDHKADEMQRKAWEECEERMHMLREEFAEVFH